MTRKFDSLCRFIEEKSAEPELAERAVELLQNFSEDADCRWTTLAEYDEKLDNEVANALHEAFGDDIEGIVYVSLTSGMPVDDDLLQGDGLTESENGDAIDTLNHLTFGTSGPFLMALDKDPRFCNGDEGDACGLCCPYLSDTVDESAIEELWILLNQEMGHEDGEADPTLAYLMMYLTFVILGCQPVTRSLDKTIEVLPRAVPFGTKTDQPGVWLVLCR